MLVTEILNPKKHDRNGFDCGVEPLNKFISKQANQSSSRSLTKTFVLIETDNPSRIIGFYTLAYASVSAPQGFSPLKNYPHPAPALKLTRMAVHVDSRGNKFGEQMLLDVINKTAMTANADNPAAVIGLFVDPKHQAIDFYKKYGFIDATSDQGELLYIPIQHCITLSAEP